MATRLIPLRSMQAVLRKTFQNALAALLLLMLPLYFAAAQEQGPQESAPEQKTSSQPNQPTATASHLQAQQPSSPGAPLVLPAETKLQVGLLRPVSVKHTKPGDNVYLQITFPVTAESQMVVPPGAYLQGAIDKITRRDRARAVLEFDMRSVSLIYSTGYTVSLAGPLTALPTSAGLRLPDMRNPYDIPAAAMVAAGTTAVPSLPAPSFGNGPRNAMIALGVAAAASTALLLVAANRSDVEMAVGTPLEIILPAAVQLDRERVAAAVQQYSMQAATARPEIVKPPEKPKMCYDPGSPGTPDTVIPGSPGTPPTVIPGMNGAPDTVIPGTPATPDTVIPGTPGTPGQEYPCPK
jgi:hypothetical protein